jgi:hypothetical protein
VELNPIPDDLRAAIHDTNRVKKAMATAVLENLLDHNVQAVNKFIKSCPLEERRLRLIEQYLTPYTNSFAHSIDNIRQHIINRNIADIRAAMKTKAFGYPDPQKVIERFFDWGYGSYAQEVEHLRIDLYARTLKAFKADLKRVGYKQLFINEHPTTKSLRGSTHMFAVPKQKTPTSWTPAIWRISDKYFEGSCGNGLPDCDQRQIRNGFPSQFHGVHEL